MTADTCDTPVRALAQTLADTLLAADPFLGTELGLRAYDAFVPDPSAAAEEQLAADLAGIAAQAGDLAPLTQSDSVTRDVIVATCARHEQSVQMGLSEFTVTAMPIVGPPALFGLLARTALADARSATDYLARVRASAEWVDVSTERLREGRAKGRLPVGSLVDNAIAWADATLSEPTPAAVMSPAPPAGWDASEAWQAELAEVARDALAPAVARWRAELAELRPAARSDDDAGIGALPGGDADYERAIAVHTTLPFSADELHRIGIAEVARLEERAAELGATIGLADLDAVRAAVRASAAELDPQAALAQAADAVRRAESRAGEIMPVPLPPPCDVTAMPATVADSGMAPHYTLPREDGSRPGTYWFNTRRPTAGTGWDLEAVAFHETVPGHHSQLARTQALPDLPLLQELVVTVHAEGWGLYAERLAGEFGLYSDVRAEIGAVYAEMFRAARLVLDTGLHAFGWSRGRAREYFVEHVAMPESFLHNEIDRYIAWPGQALAYLVGQREILRLRADARATLDAGFDLPTFNGVLLDSGSLPMPVLANVVDNWVASRATGG
jgi:uncharacterized protein (DUF885 family)